MYVLLILYTADNVKCVMHVGLLQHTKQKISVIVDIGLILHDTIINNSVSGWHSNILGGGIALTFRV